MEYRSGLSLSLFLRTCTRYIDQKFGITTCSVIVENLKEGERERERVSLEPRYYPWKILARREYEFGTKEIGSFSFFNLVREEKEREVDYFRIFEK